MTEYPKDAKWPFMSYQGITGDIDFDFNVSTFCDLLYVYANKKWTAEDHDVRLFKGAYLGDKRGNTANGSLLDAFFENLRAWEADSLGYDANKIKKPYCLVYYDRYKYSRKYSR